MSNSSELPTVEINQERVACCGLSRIGSPSRPTLFGAAIVLVTVATASYWAGTKSGMSPNMMNAEQAEQWAGSLPLINATGSVTSEKFSMATGSVSDEAEGLFVLDHNSGLLQCTCIYPRSGQFMARFSTNVAETLGTGAKGGKYLMVTGQANFPRASNRPAAATVVYVMDSATGNYACYGIPFDQTAVPRNQPQQGLMVLIGAGSANPLVDRDDLR
jgi:hypothetical protein